MYPLTEHGVLETPDHLPEISAEAPLRHLGGRAGLGINLRTGEVFVGDMTRCDTRRTLRVALPSTTSRETLFAMTHDAGLHSIAHDLSQDWLHKDWVSFAAHKTELTITVHAFTRGDHEHEH